MLLQAKMNNKQRQFEQLKTDHQKLSAEVERNMKASMQVIHWFNFGDTWFFQFFEILLGIISIEFWARFLLRFAFK